METEVRSVIENHLLARLKSSPDGTSEFVLEDIEKYQPKPSRRRGTYAYDDAASFIAAVNADKHAGTTLYAKQDPKNPRLLAVFNGYDRLADAAQAVSAGPDDLTGWGDHRAAYACPLSEEWKTWTAYDAKVMKQAEFAEFLENNLPDITVPSGAELLTACSNLQAKRNVDFASAVNTTNGQVQFTYQETVTGAGSRQGQMVLPDRFKLGIPVFVNGDPWAVDARLRYRITDGGLALWFDLERPEKVLEHAFKDVVKAVSEGIGMAALMGLPHGA